MWSFSGKYHPRPIWRHPFAPFLMTSVSSSTASMSCHLSGSSSGEQTPGFVRYILAVPTPLVGSFRKGLSWSFRKSLRVALHSMRHEKPDENPIASGRSFLNPGYASMTLKPFASRNLIASATSAAWVSIASACKGYLDAALDPVGIPDPPDDVLILQLGDLIHETVELQ